MKDSKTDTQSETGVIRLEHAEEFVQHSCEIVSSAIRQINLLSTDLEQPWFGDEAFVNAIKKAVVQNRRVKVRILVADPTLAIRRQHPLIPLIKRLSRIEARVIEDEILDKEPLKHSFLLVDRGQLVVRQVREDMIGFAHYDDKPTVKKLNETFEQYWRYSATHADLRYMHI